MQASKPDGPAKSQRKAFEEAARELGCDESEERFDETLRAVARHKPKPTDGADPEKAAEPETTKPDRAT